MKYGEVGFGEVWCGFYFLTGLNMPRDDKYVRVSDCSIGADSSSGLAFSCHIEGKHFWVPYSQVRKRVVNSKTLDSDSFEVAAWWAEKQEIESEPV